MEVFFILVEPAVPENIGASARAIKTMSFNRLRLVNPCDYLSIEARKLAHGSLDVLTAAEVFSSLDQAIHDIDFIIGTSAKSRRIKHDYYPAEQMVEFIKRKGTTINAAGIVFGREEYGLTTEEAHRCDIICSIPMAAKYPSLNLSQAVMIMAYELSALQMNKNVRSSKYPESLTLKAARAQIEEVLASIGLISNKVLYDRIIERINAAGEDDLHLLYSVCKFFRKSNTKPDGFN
ncbi:MAG: tRNA/rRNA methyltransferase [Bacteroidales bacterium]|nr:tRNA/rRNA methyltransferase [Bacteroidales bacterium]